MEKDSLLSDEELKELKDLIEKATPGEWGVVKSKKSRDRL